MTDTNFSDQAIVIVHEQVSQSMKVVKVAHGSNSAKPILLNLSK